MRISGLARALGFVASVAALAACGQSDAPPVATVQTTGPVAITTEAEKLVYSCTNGKEVLVDYSVESQSPGKAAVKLTIDGKSYVLTEEISASASRYAVESGPRPGHRMVWWVKDGADWWEGPVGKGSDVEILVAECVQKQAA